MYSVNKTADCEYFTLSTVSEGVFAAIDKGHTTGSNASIIDLGGVSVIFDTFVNIDAARELRQLCRELTGRDASYVINSHSHADHTAGNCIFNDAAIISSHVVYDQLLITKVEYEKEKSSYQKEIDEIESVLPSKTNNTELANMENSLFFLKNLNKPGVEFRVPDITFDRELIIHGKNRRLQLTAFEAAHSRGDAIATLPDCGVCFMGDLLFKGMHPWLGKGEPEPFLRALHGIMNTDNSIFVPGHGALAEKEDIVLEIQYIHELMELVKSKRSRDEKDYSVGELSPVFRSWDGLCFSWNIKFLIGRELSQQ